MKIRKIVSMIGVAALAAASFVPFTPTTPAQAGTVRDLREGETAPAGATLVVEVVDFGPRTIHINPGVGPVTERVEGLVHTNVWIVDASLEQALCEQARERFTEAQIPGGWANNPTPMQVFLKGSPFGGSCDGGAPAPVAFAPAPSGGSQPNIGGPVNVIDLKNGEVAPAGEFAVVEVVDHGAHTSCIWFGQLTSPVTEQSLGLKDVNVWMGYGSVAGAKVGADSLFGERTSESRLPRNALEGYSVNYQGQGC